MKTLQIKNRRNSERKFLSGNLKLVNPLVLVFGDSNLLESSEVIRKKIPYKHIFFRSKVGESIAENLQNSGVGLSIVKKASSFFSGKIWMRSGFLKESTYYFTLPKKYIL